MAETFIRSFGASARRRFARRLLAFSIGAGLAANAAEPILTDTHRFIEVRNGIYVAQTLALVFNSNSLVVVNEDDVVIVDSHVTPARARQLREAVKAVSDNPITTLINSHHHWDHAHGNQVFDDLPIIGHEFTYMKLATAPLEEPTYIDGVNGNARTIARVSGQIQSEQNAERKADLEAYLEMFSAHVLDFDEIAPIPPTLTMNDKMTLHRGDREMEIMFLGRAHTGGDVVVYFPQDKLVYTGDMAFAGPSYLGDGYVDEWPDTLERLKALDFDTFVPGHGPPVTDLDRLTLVQAFYLHLWGKAEMMKRSGMTAEQVSEAIDLTNHTELGIRNVGTDLKSIQRIFYRIDNEL